MIIPEHPPAPISETKLSQLDALLLTSVKTRTRNLPDAPSEPLAILFSGGLDCSLLVQYAHLTLPKDTPIDLLNVAFQNPRIHGLNIEDPYSSCPDRITGISAYHELQNNCTGRDLRLICVNIPFAETTQHKATILSLMSPHNTEMDLSIASALYFASRGSGFTYPKTDHLYTTPARVLISGLGADELFAGYNRHQIAFARNGYTGLLSELELDAGRLGKRNLGRDDRVTAHWAREVRYPFLDERVVNWAMSSPVWIKCAFGERSATCSYEHLPKDKAALRAIAWNKGLETIAKEKKRAVRSLCSQLLQANIGRSNSVRVLQKCIQESPKALIPSPKAIPDAMMILYRYLRETRILPQTPPFFVWFVLFKATYPSDMAVSR